MRSNLTTSVEYSVKVSNCQEFYDAETLPVGKKDLLEKQGREILDQFLKKNMVYNFEENSLSYYYSGDIHSSKIFLNEVKNNQKIEPKKL